MTVTDVWVPFFYACVAGTALFVHLYVKWIDR